MHIKKHNLANALAKGLGRTFEYIKQKKAEELRPDLLNACLHSLVYDRQCEESRAEWLFELINLTDEVEYYRQNILQALPDANDDWDIQQLYELAAIWAKKGDREAKQVIYEAFKKQEFNASWLGGTEIIEIDGVTGLLNVAEIFGGKLLKDEELWEDDSLISEASDRFSAEIVWHALEERSKINLNVKAYLDEVISYRQKKEERKNSKTRTTRKILELDTVLEQIEKATRHSYPLIRFGKYAEEKEIEHINERLIIETRREQLIRYLWVFRNRKMPKLDSRLLNWAEQSQDEEMQEAAISSLAKNQDDSIRNLAIKLLQKQPESIYLSAIELLINNYRSGDFQLVESVLTVCEERAFNHAVGCDLIDLTQAQKSLELVNCLLWVYQNTPCTYCRREAVEILIELKQMPEALLKECLHDCSSEIRNLAAKNA